MKTNKYPIYRDFNQRETIGWVELKEDVVFTPFDIFAPEVSTKIYGERKTAISSFGLIGGNNYFKRPRKKIW